MFFTADFFKNVIGFATILIIGIGVTALANGKSEPEKAVPASQTAASH